MKKYYAVIDTNVIVSALLSPHLDSAVVIVFQKIITGSIIPLYSSKIIDEYVEVLSRKKFSFDQTKIIRIIKYFIEKGIKIDAKPSNLHFIDQKDLEFYEVVLEKKDEGAYLITGNKKHFPIDPIVVTPAEFLEILVNDLF